MNFLANSIFPGILTSFLLQIILWTCVVDKDWKYKIRNSRIRTCQYYLVMIWGSQILRFRVVLTLLHFRDQLTSLYLGALPDLPAAAAKSLQSCPILCNPIDSSPPGSSVPGILQARTLEWVAVSFSNASKWKVKVKSLSCVRLFATLWTTAHQAPPSMGFSRQEYWSGVPLPPPPGLPTYLYYWLLTW